ncbi:exonuclease SbcC [Caldicoprobacter guelmensis]|uniref:AAA family ATPase n=1 Tax=Caldicoprobacter guelmensis TaxID=1170224 RepID=UPI0019586F55|nr:SMC family ATPase [Caldicoprobacter guelmensis]MBM7582583.1 exonuclease SbcC [Caldicoprobacter guelmensis]
MRPISLYLRNFKSYGEKAPILDFNMFDVALLSGDNGNGKSSLADAIAWCVWGKCKGMDGRGGVDDLVRTGADEMEVAFTFEEDGQVYKVVRKRDKRRGLSSLDFMIKRADAFVPISGNRIDETQQKIQEVIKLDYETYLCTGYLSQGKADLFATKKPSERKEILAEILNLAVYDKLERKALDKRNEVQNRLDLIEREMDLLQQQVAEKECVRSDMAQVENVIRELQAREKGLREQLETLNRQREEKNAIKARIEYHRQQLVLEQKQLDALEKDKKDLEVRIENYKKVLQNQHEIEKNYAEFKALEEQEKAFAYKYQRIAELKTQKERLLGELRIKEQELRHRIDMLEKEKAQLEGVIAQAKDLQEEYKTCQKGIDELNVLEKELEVLEKRVVDIGHESAELAGKEGVLRRQLEELRERYVALKGVESSCPVCGRPLDAQHRDELLKDIADQGKAIQQSLQKVKKAMADLENEKKQAQLRIDGIKARLKGRSRLESRMALIDRQLNEIKEARQKLQELRPQLDFLKEQLETKEYAKNAMQQIDEIERQIQQVGYDPQQHNIVRDKLHSLEKVPEQWEYAQKAKVQMDSDIESLQRILNLIDDRKKHVKDMELLLETLGDSIKDLPEILARLSELQREFESVQKDIRTMEARRGALKERMDNILVAEQQLEKKKEEQRQLHEQLEVYKALALIYGKRGIQAAIIENAIPELQDETNRILAKITDGRLAVEFLTQRDTRSGNVIETLDIKISDGMDTRKYETYSGGEEFRINFAIRIALAKILANRAGANMRMLILDEGFGVLDEQGRERLVEVINAIRDEFDKILVITHVQELKDAFPVQIEVIKTPEGSTFRLVG